MALFKRDVNIYCKNMEQLGRLVSWLRDNSGLTYMNQETWPVRAILPGVLNKDQSLRGFWVSVPHELAEPRIQRLSEQDAFIDIIDPPS